MSDTVRTWLDQQSRLNRQLIWVLDSLAEPSPLQTLYGADLIQHAVQLYRLTPYAEFAQISPWLVTLNNPHAEALQTLLANPERHWGWLGSMDKLDLDALTLHWQERMLIEEEGARSLFRFQDNRVIARCLASLTDSEYPLLLGPLSSVLYWDAQRWNSRDNVAPGAYPAPSPAPWLRSPTADVQSRDILRDNLKRWLLTGYVEAAAALAETRVMDEWLDEQLDLTDLWQWQQPQQRQFMLSRRLQPLHADDPAWQPLMDELPEQHFARCQQLFADNVPANDMNGV